MIKKYLKRMFDNAMNLNKNNILQLLEVNENDKLLDLGCDDGLWTMKLAKKIGTNQIYGIDIVDERLSLAKDRGIKTKKGDLNNRLSFLDNEFDVIHANQVIEHISNLDIFLSELKRVLKPGGYVVVSTENASSWHNIFASIMGWQIFSLTNISSVQSGIGNPLAIHQGEAVELSSWTHKTIFNYLGLRDYFRVYGFSNIQILGAGYYPLPSFLGKLDPMHSHFITLKAFKR